MRNAGKIIVVAAALVLGACSPSNQEPSDEPPGTEHTASQAPVPRVNTELPPAGSVTAMPDAQGGGRECTAEDIDVAGAQGEKPTIAIPDSCAPPKTVLTKDLTSGNGQEAATGSTVSVNYEMVSWSDRQEVDGSWKNGAGQPKDVTLGSGEVIPGWDEGLVGMKEGSRRLLVIPPDKGYGPQGKDNVRPNDTLVLVVDAKKVSTSGA